jgi:hypothetical protein
MGDQAAAAHALADGRLRGRGYMVSAYGESMIEPLSRSLFTVFDDDSKTVTFNVEKNSIWLVDGWHHDKCTVYRAELAWEDLIAIWPAFELEPREVVKTRQRKMEAATIDRQIADRAAELKGRVSNPVAQAEVEIAQQLGRSAPALNKWLRRNR